MAYNPTWGEVVSQIAERLRKAGLGNDGQAVLDLYDEMVSETERAECALRLSVDALDRAHKTWQFNEQLRCELIDARAQAKAHREAHQEAQRKLAELRDNATAAPRGGEQHDG